MNGRQVDPGATAEVAAILSADCNLRCSYCYQDRKRPAALEWPALRATLDLLLASPTPRRLSFTGGEPTLEFGLISRAVDYVRRNDAGGPPVLFHLVTNGLLLGRRERAFLAAHDFKLDLSFDGVPAAQDLRRRKTFPTLDALLRRLRAEHPAYFSARVAVSVTIARGTIPHLADSLAYFLSRRVRHLSIHAATGQSEWSDADLTTLDTQLSEVVRRVLDHHRSTGEIPLTVFRREQPPRPYARTWGCSAPLGQALTVDVDGQVYPCALLARSYQAFEPELDARVRLLSLGDVRDAAMPGRLAALPDACRASGLFEPKRVQHSGNRACATCRERARCVVCPIARAQPISAHDLNDIPRYLCAYERVLGKHRRRFLARATPSRAEALLSQLLAARRPRARQA